MLSLVNQQAQKETRKVEPPQPQPRNPRPPPLQNNPRVPPPQIEHDDSTIKRIPPRQQPPQQQQHEVPPQPHQRQGKRVHFLRKVRFCWKRQILLEKSTMFEKSDLTVKTKFQAVIQRGHRYPTLSITIFPRQVKLPLSCTTQIMIVSFFNFSFFYEIFSSIQ